MRPLFLQLSLRLALEVTGLGGKADPQGVRRRLAKRAQDILGALECQIRWPRPFLELRFEDFSRPKTVILIILRMFYIMLYDNCHP